VHWFAGKCAYWRCASPNYSAPLRINDILSIVAGTPVETLLLERGGDFEQSVDYISRRLLVKVCRPPGSIQLTIRTIQVDSRVPIALELDELHSGDSQLGERVSRKSARAPTEPDMAKFGCPLKTVNVGESASQSA